MAAGLAVGNISSYRGAKLHWYLGMPRSNQHFFLTLVQEEIYIHVDEYNQGWLHYDALHPQEHVASKVLEILGLDFLLVWEYPTTNSLLRHSLVAMIIL